MLDGLNDMYPNYEEGSVNPNSVELRFISGYKITDNWTVIGSLGVSPDIIVKTNWDDGNKGNSYITTKFIELGFVREFKQSSGRKGVYEPNELVPFAGAGGGIYSVRWFCADDYITMLDPSTTLPIRKATDINFGLFAITGFNYYLSEKVSLDVTGKYLYCKLQKLEGKGKYDNYIIILGGEKLKIDLGGPSILVGISYHFL
ncbi:MAG: hypothetical protein COS68_02380 [Elusimicrobia bacterium CG06_land_8_20_14_3_00_38_11]|nr:MAG: hypothetical protein COS68_02380 [Elusimicrobia bacterium CG06_land_8_20_14_3_00_38_11]